MLDPVLGSFKSREIENRPYQRRLNRNPGGSAREASGASEVVFGMGEMT